MSSANLILLIFLPAILIPASSSPAFHTMYSAYKLINRVTVYSLDVLLSWFGTSQLYHVQFQLLLLDLQTDFSGARSSGLVFPSLEEFSTMCCDPHSQLYHNHAAEVDVFLELSCFFDDPANVGNMISSSSAFSKSILNIWNFMVV